MGEILDGKGLAKILRESLKEEVEKFSKKWGRPPGLHVVLVGENPASVIYTRNKEKAALEVGMASKLHLLLAEISERALLEYIHALNQTESVDGILVQLPLPSHIAEEKVIESISPTKDVDGFHPLNVGYLALGWPRLVPCTPLGCMHLLDKTGVPLVGKTAVVVGRSNIVGKPVAQLLLRKHMSVRIVHSRSLQLAEQCREADVLVAAVGKPELIRGGWIKKGAIVIDVGINRTLNPLSGKSVIVGDVCFEEAKEQASFITPVPGGVGPMTIFCLLENTLKAAGLKMLQ